MIDTTEIMRALDRIAEYAAFHVNGITPERTIVDPEHDGWLLRWTKPNGAADPFVLRMFVPVDDTRDDLNLGSAVAREARAEVRAFAAGNRRARFEGGPLDGETLDVPSTRWYASKGGAFYERQRADDYKKTGAERTYVYVHRPVGVV